MDHLIKAVVHKVVPQGKHGPFAVASSEKLNGSITFSLEPTVWKEKEWPEEGMVVFLARLRLKRAGWRAKLGRFWKPSDEQGAKKMSDLREALTGAYSEQWTSADVREGNCSLELCSSSLRRKPDGELVRSRWESTANTKILWIEPQTVLREIFRQDPYGLYLGFIHRCPGEGKVDAPEATRLWKEWQVRTGLHGRPYGYQFLKEVGLPIEGSLLVKGELDPALAKASGITREAWEYELAHRRPLYIHVETKQNGQRGMFVTCDGCKWKPRSTKFVNVHSPWEVSASGAETKMAELSASSFYRNPVRRADWDCPHATELLALIKTF